MRNLTQQRPQTIWDFMNEMNSLFDAGPVATNGPSNTISPSTNRFSLNTDIEELENAYLLSFDVPGMRKEDIQVDFSEGRLTVRGERKRSERDSKTDGFRRIEKSYGVFERSFQLPRDIDASQIKANHDNGQLEIFVPKAESAKPKAIEIESDSGGFFSKILSPKGSDDQH